MAQRTNLFPFLLPKIFQKYPKPHSFLAGTVLLQVLEVCLLTPAYTSPWEQHRTEVPAYPTPRDGTNLLYSASVATSTPSSFITIVSSSSIFLLPLFIKKLVFPYFIVTSYALLNTKAAGHPACGKLWVLRERRNRDDRDVSLEALAKGCWCLVPPAPRRSHEERGGDERLLSPAPVQWCSFTLRPGV